MLKARPDLLDEQQVYSWKFAENGSLGETLIDALVLNGSAKEHPWAYFL